VHHLVYRSQLGADASDNLITLCATCHHRQHNKISDNSISGRDLNKEAE
jgi:5-methylcytosine-specific restriction endonuclease McrA